MTINRVAFVWFEDDSFVTFVPFKYLSILLTANAWEYLVPCEYLAD
jgi:hypothetical protein